jgi:CheY-like chemotaxis protein
MDCTRAQQLLLNLCVNALDAMSKGGRLSISNTVVKLAPDQAAKAHSITGAEFARCSVSDTGTGIPPEVLNRIFDPFFTTKEKGKGTGLGLSIAQTAINQANGFIEVDSVPGQGTTFHVFLPRIRDEMALKVEKKQIELSKGTGRVMVVDDLDLVLDFTRAFLETVGYEVLPAASAEDALTLLASQEKTVDLIFTDYNMPGMNGLQLIQQIGARFPDMRFILASGYLEDAERAILTKWPNVRVLDKPFNMRDAAHVIAEMLAFRFL